MRVWETFVFHASKDELLPALSAVGTLAVIIILGYVLNHIANKEEIESRKEKERLQRAAKQRMKDEGIKYKHQCRIYTYNVHTNNCRPQPYDDILRELRSETYFGMVRLLKPGCRTIAVLVSNDTKQTILPEFRRCVWPWRKFVIYWCSSPNLCYLLL
jgi:DnaJ family protein C protein 16